MPGTAGRAGTGDRARDGLCEPMELTVWEGRRSAVVDPAVRCGEVSVASCSGVCF